MSMKPTSAKHSSTCSSGWKKLSKLTKIGVDGQEIGAHGPPLEADHAGSIIGEQHGFKISETSCCNMDSTVGGLCLPNRSEYVFWDAFHPKDAANAVVAQRMFAKPSIGGAPPPVRAPALTPSPLKQ
ncbi:hypothetical protein Taro_026611 [Colocasia esculenta]|uniref:GDSL esterase/lipase n=1 Tax=Colocasia esculenta TaxID=4460 RepID=A0A843VHM4_COLES|nr:hypothetical protein [Colocasia esculenta]